MAWWTWDQDTPWTHSARGAPRCLDMALTLCRVGRQALTLQKCCLTWPDTSKSYLSEWGPPVQKGDELTILMSSLPSFSFSPAHLVCFSLCSYSQRNETQVPTAYSDLGIHRGLSPGAAVRRETDVTSVTQGWPGLGGEDTDSYWTVSQARECTVPERGCWVGLRVSRDKSGGRGGEWVRC